MADITNKCPMCAETIPADAVFCPYCGTRFGEKVQVAPPVPSTAAPPPAAPVNKPLISTVPPPARKGRALTRAIGLMIILGGVVILLWSQRAKLSFLPSMFASPTPTATRTLTPTRTNVPTYTPLPTFTSTPLPEIVTFDTLGTYPVGSLVSLSGILELFSSTYCDTDCGLLLSEYSGSDNTITIFVRVAQEGVDPSPNQMKALPDPYSKWDIVVCLDDGTLAYIGNRITVTGKVCETTSGKPCISQIIKIEKENK